LQGLSNIFLFGFEKRRKNSEFGRLFGIPRSKLVNCDGEDDYCTDYDFLDVIWPAHLLAAVSQKCHDKGADNAA